MPIPAVVAGGIAAAPKISKTLSTIGGALGIGKPKDNVLIKNRNNIFTLFKSIGSGPGNPGFDAAVSKNKMSHANIPKEKPKGQTYQEEFDRMYNMVIDAFDNMGRPDLSKLFTTNQPRWKPEDPNKLAYLTTIIKGAGSKPAVALNDKRYEVLRPFSGLMVSALTAKGIPIPTSFEDLIQVFYNNFVAVKNAYNLETYEPIDFQGMSPEYHLDDALVDAVVSYVKSLQDQKNSGVQLPKTLDQIATSANKVQTVLEEKTKEQIGNELGGKLMDNAPVIIIAFIVLIIIVTFSFSRK